MFKENIFEQVERDGELVYQFKSGFFYDKASEKYPFEKCKKDICNELKKDSYYVYDNKPSPIVLIISYILLWVFSYIGYINLTEKPLLGIGLFMIGVFLSFLIIKLGKFICS